MKNETTKTQEDKAPVLAKSELEALMSGILFRSLYPARSANVLIQQNRMSLKENFPEKKTVQSYRT